MKIRSMTYKGFNYTIHFADSGDWGKYINHFYTESENNFTGGYDKVLEVVDARIKENIDEFLASAPKTKEEFLELVSGCIVWDGYEDAHIDLNRVWFLYEMAKRAGV